MALFNSEAPTTAPRAGGIEAAMGIARTAGVSSAVTRAAIKEAYKDAPKSEFWLNIGYEVDVTFQTAEGMVTETQFVSLPKGIALDSQELLPTSSSNENYANLNAAKNDLISQIREAAALLRPGERTVLTLEVELRRVNAPQPATGQGKENPFIRKMGLIKDAPAT